MAETLHERLERRRNVHGVRNWIRRGRRRGGEGTASVTYDDGRRASDGDTWIVFHPVDINSIFPGPNLRIPAKP